ncbi:MAG: alpha/beta hydrolase [Pseudooceanicola sp.]
MAVLRINAGPGGLTLHGMSGGMIPALETALRGDGPIVIMVHGFKFAPGHPQHCPHDHILSDSDGQRCWKARSWPRALGLTEGRRTLGIAFGWPARGTIWQAYAEAERAGLALAALIRRLRRLAPHRPVRAIAHSLGGRVVLSALPALDPGDLDRAILLTPAEFLGRAQRLLDTPAGRAADILTVTSGENAVFDRLLETFVGGGLPRRAMGRAARLPAHVVTLRLDDEAALLALARIGHPVALPSRRVCHWSSYLRPGALDLYRALLCPVRVPDFADLRAALPPVAPPVRTGRRQTALGHALPTA